MVVGESCEPIHLKITQNLGPRMSSSQKQRPSRISSHLLRILISYAFSIHRTIHRVVAAPRPRRRKSGQVLRIPWTRHQWLGIYGRVIVLRTERSDATNGRTGAPTGAPGDWEGQRANRVGFGRCGGEEEGGHVFKA